MIGKLTGNNIFPPLYIDLDDVKEKLANILKSLDRELITFLAKACKLVKLTTEAKFIVDI